MKNIFISIFLFLSFIAKPVFGLAIQDNSKYDYNKIYINSSTSLIDNFNKIESNNLTITNIRHELRNVNRSQNFSSGNEKFYLEKFNELLSYKFNKQNCSIYSCADVFKNAAKNAIYIRAP